MSQADRVLAALHAHRDRGITQVDFLRWPTIDAGPPITRVAARVEELRDQGFRIDSGERRDKCVVYRIRVVEAVHAQGSPTPTATGVPTPARPDDQGPAAPDRAGAGQPPVPDPTLFDEAA